MDYKQKCETLKTSTNVFDFKNDIYILFDY